MSDTPLGKLKLPPLREAYNVADALERDGLVRRLRRLRADMLSNRRFIMAWNAANPDQPPISTEVEDAVLGYLDGARTFADVQRAYLRWKGAPARGDDGAAR